jgi:predicted permease
VLLFAGAGLLLVVACANVAGLLLSQADSRRQEMAVRRALGAGPATLLRHLLTECLFVAAAAGIAGALLAWWLTPALAALTDRVPGLDAVRVNGRVVGFALLATMATVVLSGVVPAWVLSRVAPADALKQGARTATRPQRRWHQAIMAAQVALSFLLLIGASLLVETMLQLSSKPLPFDAENLATISTRMVEGVSETDAALALPAVEAIVEQLEEIPGVVSAGAASAVPFLGSSSSGGDRMPAAEGGPPVQVWRAPVTRRYFETMRMPVRGRSFAGPSSDAGLVIVSEAFGRRVFGDDAVGRRLQFSPMMVPGLTNRSAPPAAHPPAEVIGVVPDLAGYHPSDPDFPLVYVLREEFPSSLTLHFVVRTQGSPDALLPLLRETIASASPHLLVTDSAPMTAVIARSLASERLRALLSTTLAATALLLVVVGLYAHAARLVSDRRREVGLRLAIGAGPREITALFIRQGLKPMLLGLALGVPLAYVISSAMASFVFGVSPTAPHAFLFAASVLVLVGAAATWQPVTRAARLDPTTTLREE